MNQIYFIFFIFALSSSQICMYTDNNNNCLTCVDGYYLSNSICLSCSSSLIYCTRCSNNKCLQCQSLYSLYNDTCYYCPIGQYYNGICNNCSTNCNYCNSSACIQCQYGFFVVDGKCVQITSFNISNNSNTVSMTSYLLNYISNSSILTRKDLMYNCLNNGFICICPSNDNLSSLCKKKNYNTQIDNLYNQITKDLNNESIYLYSLITQYKYNDTDAIMSNLIKYVNTNFANNLGVNLNYLQTVLSIYSKLNYTYENYNNLRNNISNIANILNTNLNNSGPLSILLQGNGFIFKFTIFNQSFYPNSNDTAFQNFYLKSFSQQGYDYQFVIFDKLVNHNAISGIYFIGNNLNDSKINPINIILPVFNSLNYYENLQAFTLQALTGAKYAFVPSNSTQITINTNNTATVNFTLNGNQVLMINGTTTNTYDPFILLRIQNIFYQTSIFYILFFILLYLIFIPLCLLIDFVDQTKLQKKHQEREPTQQGLHPDPPSQPNSQVQVENVTFKQFLPIYNIAATPNRGSRIIKLLLYILNMQHSITFLVLLYTPVPKLGIWAVLLAIPVYLINITMSYIVGAIKIRLPGYWKLLINILVPVYWIIWYILMKNLNNEFLNYVLIFTIVLLILDFLFDCLQMMIMYFILKEKNDTYSCVSKILSERGYFQYNKYSVE